MYKQKKTDYQRGYDDGKELVATHINADGKVKAKEYIKKLADKNKGKTDALEYFVNNSASYFVPPQFISENIKQKMNKNRLKQIIKEAINNEIGGTDDIMDAILMLKEAYYDLTQLQKLDKTLAFDIQEAMGNIRGAIKIMNKFA